jgi:hypothetical protein
MRSGRRVAQEWYQSLKLCSMCEENVSTMPLRISAEPLVANRVVEREMIELHIILDAMETTQRRAPDAGEIINA